MSARVVESAGGLVRQVRGNKLAFVAIVTITVAVAGPAFAYEKTQPQQAFALSPLRFEPNVGQAGAGIHYIVRGAGYAMALRSSEVGISLDSGTALRMTLLGSSGAALLQAEEKLASVSHYYIGDDPSKWRTNVPNYGRVRFNQIYPGIDLIYYGNQQQLEYDFLLQPGADPSKIRLAFSGADSIKVDAHGDLVLTVQGKELRQKKPTVYQEIDGKRTEISCGYELADASGEVRLAVANYDPSRTLVIDPVLVFSTYLEQYTSSAYALAVDGSGAVYVTGQAQGPYGQTGGFIAKLSASGGLVYSTYVGGSFGGMYGWGGWGTGIAVDVTGAAAVTGNAGWGLPLLNSVLLGCDSGDLLTGGPYALKLSPTGTLVYSTYLCGSSSQGIAMDGAGGAYITGYTTGNFVTQNAAQATYGGGAGDAFVIKLSSTGALVYATFLGGPFDDAGYAIAADSSGSAYVTGRTAGGFPVLNAEQGVFGGGYDAFIAKLDPTGALVYSTYLGGVFDDRCTGIAADSFGAAYVTGGTEGGFPILNAAQSISGTSPQDSADEVGFVAKLSPNGSLVYSTYFGVPLGGLHNAIATDGTGAAYIAGVTGPGLPTLNALQSTYGGGVAPAWGDAFVAEFSPSGTLVYSTYLGGPGDDGAYAVGASSAGAAYVAGYAGAGFPLANAYQSTTGSGNSSVFVAEISPFAPISTATIASITPNGVVAGQAQFMLTVAGSGFQSSATVFGNGTALLTTFGGVTSLTATVPANLVAPIGGVVSITVTNPGQSSSNAAILTVNTPFAECTYSFASFVKTFPQTGGTGAAAVGSGAGCTWIALSTASWLGITGGTPGAGNGSVMYNVAENTGGFRSAQIIVNGQSYTVNQLARRSASIADYDGDGKADLAVFRRSNESWSILPSSTDGPSLGQLWGIPGDIPVIGDFDGDKVLDLAVFRPSTGAIYAILSSNGWLYQTASLEPGIPVPADYDGDGITDNATYYPSGQDWHIFTSSGVGSGTFLWGSPGDQPVQGDFDGDGRNDLATWSPGSGIWNIWASRGGFFVVKWGLPGDIPVPADYDGDGKTDLALYRPSNQTWYILPSSTGVPYSRTWGIPGDQPVVLDYDGDGKNDLAVYRPSNQTWYILQSATGTIVQQQYGIANDIPIYRPWPWQ